MIKAINDNGIPEKITIDGSAANKAAIEGFNNDNDATIEVRQVKYLNNIVEQDNREIKRITNLTLGFKSFDSATITLNGIEMVHMLKKRQLQSQDNSLFFPSYSLRVYSLLRDKISLVLLNKESMYLPFSCGRVLL